MDAGSFAGLRVLSLESRRAREVEQLISKRGGTPVVVPSVREAPVEASDELREFVRALLASELASAIFLTGVGARALITSAGALCGPEPLLDALRRLPMVARSHKPAAVLREFNLPVAFIAPEPNTTHEVLQAIDGNTAILRLRDSLVAVQEHGAPSDDLHRGLADRGARVLPVFVYRWLLPEDTAPLRDAVAAIVRGEIDVMFLTAAVQLQHLLAVADSIHMRPQLIEALQRTVVASVGPVCTAELRRHGIRVDFEPSHPKLGLLVNETADRIRDLIPTRR